MLKQLVLAGVVASLGGCAIFCKTCDDPLQIKRYGVIEPAPSATVMDVTHPSQVVKISGSDEHVVCWGQACPTARDMVSTHEKSIWVYFMPDPFVDPFDLKGLKEREEKARELEEENARQASGDKKFPFDSAKLVGEMGGLLKAAAFAKECQSCRVEITGHADAKGSDRYNDALSKKRAMAVKAWLIRNGVSEDRIAVMGKGEKYPVATNDTESGRASNRRAEFKINIHLATDGD